MTMGNTGSMVRIPRMPSPSKSFLWQWSLSKCSLVSLVSPQNHSTVPPDCPETPDERHGLHILCQLQRQDMLGSGENGAEGSPLLCSVVIRASVGRIHIWSPAKTRDNSPRSPCESDERPAAVINPPLAPYPPAMRGRVLALVGWRTLWIFLLFPICCHTSSPQHLQSTGQTLASAVDQKWLSLASQGLCREETMLGVDGSWLAGHGKGRYRPGLSSMHGTWQKSVGVVSFICLLSDEQCLPDAWKAPSPTKSSDFVLEDGRSWKPCRYFIPPAASLQHHQPPVRLCASIIYPNSPGQPGVEISQSGRPMMLISTLPVDHSPNLPLLPLPRRRVRSWARGANIWLRRRAHS
ncbi:hypothetical protein QBC37DRAFT_46053 [Rhypophila decipiens]|uniref:Uncharacterized protein n=1 Tax=Rhypophila decipiens TaxID=261697 RepID=A0AAN6YFB8_9PEZI|nr:hypothetical protein QBC37DRAFT_46053 [Rhypophila decipiens]